MHDAMSNAMNTLPTRPRGWRCLLVLLCLSLLQAACSLPYGYKGKGEPLPLTGAAGPKSPQGSSFTEYRVGPGDVLEFIFRQDSEARESFTLSPLDTVSVNFLSSPSWNSQQRIRPDGSIALPYQPEVVIAGLSVPQATQKIEALYTQILQNPKVFLSVIEFQTRQERLRASLFHPGSGSSRLIAVQTDGRLSLPFAGVVQAGGVPFVRLKEQIQAHYRDRHGMEMDVLLNKPAGQKVYLVGMLNQPGAYEMTGPTTVLQAVSLARGFREDAQLAQVILVRREGNTMVCRPLDLTATLEGRGSDGLTQVESGDIVFVPRTRLASAAEVANQISAISFFRGLNASMSWQLKDSNGNVQFF